MAHVPNPPTLYDRAAARLLVALAAIVVGLVAWPRPVDASPELAMTVDGVPVSFEELAALRVDLEVARGHRAGMLAGRVTGVSPEELRLLQQRLMAIEAVEARYDRSVVLAGRAAILAAPYARTLALDVEPSDRVIRAHVAADRERQANLRGALFDRLGADAYWETYRPLRERYELSQRRLAMSMGLPAASLNAVSIRLAANATLEVAEPLGATAEEVRAYLADLEALVDRSSASPGLY
ncbi:MAG: hypothetical protein AB7F65_04230 [Dehalococcoidia bacterium]